MRPSDQKNTAVEFNFDGIPVRHTISPVFPSGTLLRRRHTNQPSNPRQAALQGLEKMKLLADLGVPQGVLPPHERPDVSALRRIGFAGSDANVLKQAARPSDSSGILRLRLGDVGANAATVSPSA